MADSIKAARHETAKLLAAALTAFDVFPVMSNLDEIQRPTLQLRRTRIVPDPSAPNARRLHDVELQLVMPTETTDDQLDDALDEVLDALHDLRIVWTEVARRNWAEKPAYAITITAASNWARPTS